MFTEWVYINNVWEVFGSIAVDLSGYLTDVQIDGTSIVTDGVAEIPIAKSNTAGALLVKQGQNGLGFSNSYLSVYSAQKVDVKAGIHMSRPIVPNFQHESTFYGLAKVAGYDERYSKLPVGTYTDKAKSAIHDMLNGAVQVEGTTPTITALSGVRYVCGEVATLDITPCVSGICDIVFTSGNTATVLTLPSTVKFPDGEFVPDADTTYELNIMDGIYGAVMAWT